MSHTISGYLKAFNKARETRGRSPLTGDVCLVAKIPQDDLATKSAIVIASGPTRQVNGLEAKRATLVKVLDVGPGFYGDDKESIPADANPGDILLVGNNSFTEISQYGRLMNHGRVELGFVNASQALGRWTEAEFEKEFETILGVVNEV